MTPGQKAKRDAAGQQPGTPSPVALLREYVGMDDETVRDIEKARQDFDTEVTEPDPNAARHSQRKVGSVAATKKGTSIRAGSLTFGVEEDEHHNQLVRTTQFTTEPDFEGQHVALLLAYDLRDHYGVDHSTPPRWTLQTAGQGSSHPFAVAGSWLPRPWADMHSRRGSESR